MTVNTVAFEPDDQFVHVCLKEGKIDLCVYFSNEGDSGGELSDAMTAWVNDSALAIIAPHFSIAAPIDGLIGLNEMPAYGNAIHENSRLIFEAVKREMQEQIKRIDALHYAFPD